MEVSTRDDGVMDWAKENSLQRSIETSIREKTQLFDFFGRSLKIRYFSSPRCAARDFNCKFKIKIDRHRFMILWVQYNSNIKRWCITLHPDKSAKEVFGQETTGKMTEDFDVSLIAAVDGFVDNIKKRISVLSNSSDPKDVALLATTWKSILGVT